ncbi:MAG: hypothetical protein RLZZ401_2339 [Pseudomonadota bacterium]|jgi:PAS domain S-box-containing protein
MTPGKLLSRQLRKVWGLSGPEDLQAVLAALAQLAQQPGVPDLLHAPLRQLGPVLALVDAAYVQFDRDLDLSRRSLELSSTELYTTNQRLRDESQQVVAASATLRQTIEHLTEGLDLVDTGALSTSASSLTDLETVTQRMVQLVEAHRVARQEMQLSEQRLALAVQGSRIGLWDWTLATDHVFFSDEWAGMLGYQASDLAPISATLMDLVHPDDIKAFMRAIGAYFEAQRTDTFRTETRLRGKDGSYKWVEYCGRVVNYTPAGEPVRATGVSIDITDRKNYEQAMEAARDAAEAASRAKGDFLANMSHEIRTPMNGILGMTELCLATPLNPQQKDYLEMVQTSAKALLVVINDVLDVSKIEANKLELESVAFSLHQTVRHSMAPMSLRAQGQSLKLHTLVAPDVPDWVIGDAGRLRQVLLNLVGNAIKFTEQGSVTLRISAQATSALSTQVRFSVSDTGIGIAANRLSSVFEAFSQADSSISRRYGGTGLGLTISAQLVSLMGGALEVKSDQGQGTEFWFELPLKRGQPPVEVVAPSGATTASLRLLVAEDHPINQMVARKVLEQMGHSVTMAANGLLAVEKYTAERFDLIFMDIQMPDLDGFGATRQIRALEAQRTYRTPILAMTAHAMDGYREKCLAGGMDGYVTKPVDRVKLAAEIRRVMALA